MGRKDSPTITSMFGGGSRSMIGFDYADVRIFQSYHNLVRNLNVLINILLCYHDTSNKQEKIF